MTGTRPSPVGRVKLCANRVGRGKKFFAGTGKEVPAYRGLAPRTYGDGLPGATTMLRGAYELRGGVGDRLLEMLPPLPGTRPWPIPPSATR